MLVFSYTVIPLRVDGKSGHDRDGILVPYDCNNNDEFWLEAELLQGSCSDHGGFQASVVFCLLSVSGMMLALEGG